MAQSRACCGSFEVRRFLLDQILDIFFIQAGVRAGIYFVIDYGGTTQYHCLRGGGAARLVSGSTVAITLRCVNYVGQPAHLDCHWRGRCLVQGETLDGLSARLCGLPLDRCSLIDGYALPSPHSRHSQLCQLQQYLRTSRGVPPGMAWGRCALSVRRAQEQLVERFAARPGRAPARSEEDLPACLSHAPSSHVSFEDNENPSD